MTSPRPRSIPVERDDCLEIEITGLGDGPDGLGKVDNYIIFVPGVLPGERAYVRVTSANRKFARAELLELLTQSPERVEPRCPHFLRCGGCHRQHQDYQAQLRDKQARLERTVHFALGDRAGDRTMGDRAPIVKETVPAKPPYSQRHKVAIHLRNTRNDGLEACFHRLRSPELVTVTECPASDPLAWDLAMRTIELLHELPHGAWDPDFAPNALLRSVLVRTTTIGDAHLLLVARDPFIPGLESLYDDLHAAGATTISVNGNNGEFSVLLGPDTRIVSGPPRIQERIGDIFYLISPDAFFQTSPQAAAHLVSLVTEWLAPTRSDDVLDLYCGGGLLTLPLALRARSALGVELSRTAVRDAEAASKANRLHNCEFKAGHAEAILGSIRRGELPRPHLVAMDPPRTGLDPIVVDELGRLRPRRLAYVSCDPQALQRDLRALAEVGFQTRSVVPIDMFPQTCHVESLACLERST